MGALSSGCQISSGGSCSDVLWDHEWGGRWCGKTSIVSFLHFSIRPDFYSFSSLCVILCFIYVGWVGLRAFCIFYTFFFCPFFCAFLGLKCIFILCSTLCYSIKSTLQRRFDLIFFLRSFMLDLFSSVSCQLKHITSPHVSI